MTIVKPLVLSFSLLAFAGANSYANEPSKNQSGARAPASAKQGFAALDTNNDGSLSRIEAAADADAKSRFEKLDQNQDQKLSRSEYESAQGQGAASGASEAREQQRDTQAQQQRTPPQQPTQRQADMPWERDSAAAGGTGAQAAQQRGELRASNLKGMQVVDTKGEEIGDISELVIDLNSGRVHAAVLEFGGVLGVGEENYAFPISELRPGKQADQVVMNIDKQALESRDGFAKNQWPGMDDEYWGHVGGKQAGAGSGAQSGKMNLVRSSELIGKEVQDKSGKQVGEVQDIIVSLQDGEVKNIVISFEDGGGRANVPAKSIKASGTDNRLVLNMDAQQLKQQAQKSSRQSQSQSQQPTTQSGAAGGTTGSAGGQDRQQQQRSGSGK
ncbi:MAG TPA: PRC-barrel domain-containing protein [Burkholderiales bacterium]